MEVLGLHAVFSYLHAPLDREDSEPLAEAALRHHYQLVKVHGQCPVIPARFGQVFGTVSALRDAVAAEADRWRSLLQIVGDRSEFSLLIDTPLETRQQPMSTNGLSYLQEQARLRSKKQADLANLGRAAAALQQALDAIGASPQVTQKAPGSIEITALLQASERVGLEREVQRLLGGAAKLQVRLRGPWPPYSAMLCETSESVGV
ncbi:MAG: GvpL/GvpF family gas vesicle protein [Pseudomonadota bacterium]